PTDSETSNSYAKQSIALANRLNFQKGKIDAYSIIGKNHHENYNQKEAIESYMQAINICKQFGDQYKLGKLYYRLGNVYNDSNSYATALENYFSASKIFEQINKIDDAAVIYCQIANIYRGLDDFEKSEKYLN